MTDFSVKYFDPIVCLILLGIVSFTCFHRYFRRGRWLWKIWRRCLPPVLVALAAIVLMTGFLGMPETTSAATGSGAPGSASTNFESQSGIVNAIRLLKLDGSAQLVKGWYFVGYGAAILLLTMLALELNRILLFDALQSGWLSTKPQHVIVCGLGSIGMQLVRDLHKQQRLTFVIERDESNPHLDDARELGAQVLIKDATDDEALQRAGVGTATELFAVTGRDTSNSAVVAMAMRLRAEYFQESSDAENQSVVDRISRSVGSLTQKVIRYVMGCLGMLPSGPLKCYAHVDSHNLAAAARMLNPAVRTEPASPAAANGTANGTEAPTQNAVQSQPPESCSEIEFILPEELAAVDLVLEHVRKCLEHQQQNELPLHFVLFGFGIQGQAVARQIAELLHLRNLKRTRVTILADDQRQIDRFRSEFPAFAPDLSDFRQDAGNQSIWKLPAEADSWDDHQYHAVKHFRSPESAKGNPVHGVSFVCNADFGVLAADPVDDAVVQGVQSILDPSDALPMLVVCTDDENTNAAVSRRLRERLGRDCHIPAGHPWEQDRLPIFVSLPEQTILHDTMALVSQDQENAVCRLIPFARTDTILGYQQIAKSPSRELAKWFAANYAKGPKGELPDPDAHWSRMSPWERHSNLSAAAHAVLKADVLELDVCWEKLPTAQLLHQQVQCQQSEDSAAVQTSQPKPELNKMEHNRFLAERLMAGWKWVPEKPSQEQKDRQKVNHTLVSWQTLTRHHESEIKKDDDQNRQLIMALASPPDQS